jgi:hypothetical protein
MSLRSELWSSVVKGRMSLRRREGVVSSLPESVDQDWTKGW